MHAKRLSLTLLVALLLLPCLFSCTLDEDWTTTAPCLVHKDANVNAVCDICGETSLTPGEGVAYEDYTALTADEQLAFIESFADMEDFLVWYDVATCLQLTVK